jgi:7 transmembrane sweet-taste receptor of 3 GCPR
MSLKRVGTWTTGSGYVPCDNDYITHSSLTGGCSAQEWGTPGNVKPADRADPVVETMSSQLKGFIIALSVIVFVSTSGIKIALVAYRGTRLLKASQSPMLWIITTGLLFGAARIAVASVDIGTSSCIASYWMGHLSFAALTAMLAKTLRVQLIVNAKAMKKVKITTTQIIGFTGALIAVSVVLMAFITPLNALSAAWFTREAITGQLTYVYFCQSRNPNLDWILYTYEMVLILVAAKLCYDTRSVPDAVNEAPAIARVIFIITAVSAAAFAFVFVLGLDPWLNEVITAIAFFVSCMAVVCYYFGPKLYLLLTGADLDKHFKIVRRDKTEREKEHEEANKNKIYAATAEDVADAEKNDKDAWRTGENGTQVDKYLVKLPKAMIECNDIIKVLEARVMILAQRATQGSNSLSNSNGSGSASTGSRASANSQGIRSSIDAGVLASARRVPSESARHRPHSQMMSMQDTGFDQPTEPTSINNSAK